jgi:hypothetical protein
MNPELIKRAWTGVGVGLGLQLLCRIFLSGEGPSFLLAATLCLVGTLMFIWGCTSYARAKGLPDWLGYLGLLSVVGLFVLIFLPPSRTGEL